ncbi:MULTISPECIES: hypothetical protein [unclassified Agarivorans]|uniref:hypothetical protein n=1 Tax=unclassified Agarivorans TaxID=2636026 RepID=UPI0026E2B0CB|nr:MULTISPECIES: hypothetical protein [unclassified Agarivorans]MDO6686740.1 hypothetical protein [Agarivorans sp. 3_MG-2023]MDO6716530.1 hypothetical protein [Agarivorans sp. 2_MG-2023]
MRNIIIKPSVFHKVIGFFIFGIGAFVAIALPLFLTKEINTLNLVKFLILSFFYMLSFILLLIYWYVLKTLLYPIVADQRGISYKLIQSREFNGFIPWSDIRKIDSGKKMSSRYLVIHLKKGKVATPIGIHRNLFGKKQVKFEFNVFVFWRTSSEIADLLQSVK